MKKRLFLIPMIAGLVLSGCSFEIFGIKFGKDQEIEKRKEDPVPPAGDDTAHDPVLKEEWENYKIATDIVDNGHYFLGVYRSQENIMRFFNGKYHSDDKGVYPYYMSTDVNSTANAAEIIVHFVSGSTTDFYMEVSSPGNIWDGKYIGVYSASSSYGNNVMSVAPLDSPTQTVYYNPDKQGNPTSEVTDVPNTVFKYYDKQSGKTVKAPAALYQYPGVDENAVPKFLGTGHATSGSDFKSIDCKTYEVAIDGIAYDLAHLYELKE